MSGSSERPGHAKAGEWFEVKFEVERCLVVSAPDPYAAIDKVRTECGEELRRVISSRVTKPAPEPPGADGPERVVRGWRSDEHGETLMHEPTGVTLDWMGVGSVAAFNDLLALVDHRCSAQTKRVVSVGGMSEWRLAGGSAPAPEGVMAGCPVPGCVRVVGHDLDLGHRDRAGEPINPSTWESAEAAVLELMDASAHADRVRMRNDLAPAAIEREEAARTAVLELMMEGRRSATYEACWGDLALSEGGAGCCPQCRHPRTPPAAPPVPGDRPGGWVDGIGWVALAADLKHRDWFIEGVGGRQFMRGLGELWPGSVVIVTQWADGSVPEPPGTDGPERVVRGWRSDEHGETLMHDPTGVTLDWMGVGSVAAFNDLLALVDHRCSAQTERAVSVGGMSEWRLAGSGASGSPEADERRPGKAQVLSEALHAAGISTRVSASDNGVLIRVHDRYTPRLLEVLDAPPAPLPVSGERPDTGSLVLGAEDRFHLWALLAGIQGGTVGFDGSGTAMGRLLTDVHRDITRALTYFEPNPVHHHGCVFDPDRGWDCDGDCPIPEIAHRDPDHSDYVMVSRWAHEAERAAADAYRREATEGAQDPHPLELLLRQFVDPEEAADGALAIIEAGMYRPAPVPSASPEDEPLYETGHVVWLKTMPEWVDLAYALQARDRLFGNPDANSLDRFRADAEVANMAVRLQDALPSLAAADRGGERP